MARKNHAEHARVTAICVNLALDGVEGEIRKELVSTSAETAAALVRILAQVKRRRLSGEEIEALGSC